MRHGKLQYGSFYGRGGLKIAVFGPIFMFFDVSSSASFCVAGWRQLNPIGRVNMPIKMIFAFMKFRASGGAFLLQPIYWMGVFRAFILAPIDIIFDLDLWNLKNY